MTVCRYYLEGRCRYGDRCWNEHVDPSSGPQRRDNYTWVSPSVASSRNYPQTPTSRGNFSSQYQTPTSRGNFSSQYQTPTSRDNFSNQYQTQTSRGSFSSQYREPPSRRNYGYDDNWNNTHNPPRNQYSDRYGWNNTPSSYDHHSSESYERSKAPKQNTFQPKPSNRYEVLSQLNDTEKSDKDNTLISSVKSDITEWEDSHIWPFSCHSHFKDYGACLSGFVDLSPEELRYKAYEAEKSGSFVLYTGIVADAMNEVKKKWDVLKNPTADILESIQSYQGTPDFCAENLKKLIGESTTAGSFGGQGNSEMFIQDNSAKTSGSFSFKLAHFDPSSQPLGSSTSAFKSVLPSANKVESSFPSFGVSSSSGFGSASPSVLASPSTSSVSSGFGSSKEKQDVTTKSAVSSDTKSGAYTPLENLTESERAQFSSQTFTLGKIPSRPPPMELCF